MVCSNDIRFIRAPFLFALSNVIPHNLSTKQTPNTITNDLPIVFNTLSADDGLPTDPDDRLDQDADDDHNPGPDDPVRTLGHAMPQPENGKEKKHEA
jgi:hypothetical protein